jgi:hypothetical protein
MFNKMDQEAYLVIYSDPPAVQNYQDLVSSHPLPEHKKGTENKGAFGLTSATCFCVFTAEAEPNEPIRDLLFPPRPAFASGNPAAESELLLLR